MKLSNSVSWMKKSDSVGLLDQMSVVSKNPNYMREMLGFYLPPHLAKKKIMEDRLDIFNCIGEGAFGRVFKGYLRSAGSDENILVAVKILKPGVCSEAKCDFLKEIDTMSAFDHENILKLIGIVVRDSAETPEMVFEYMDYGDLAELLRRSDPSGPTASAAPLEIRTHELADMAVQIAAGMVYLVDRHFVHRDLATRNCLVGRNLVVKISDFGMSRDIYTCDYYKIGGSRMLPVRWMSPEAIKYGKFTTESDVWAFGVVLWEMYSFGIQPYYGHTNEEVMRFILDGIMLQKPKDCPSAIYHTMLGCWRSTPSERSTFQKINHHLVEYCEGLSKSPLLQTNPNQFKSSTTTIEEF
ncbi:DgyrCDS9675 [Dimorphilus gyrociliatus]|nr:DgyrCDS9675 [Dimorphilus gyrociliatus]